MRLWEQRRKSKHRRLFDAQDDVNKKHTDERMEGRLQAMGQGNYATGFQLTLQPRMLELPLSWKNPQSVFVNSMSALFHKDVSLGEWLHHK